MGDKAALAALGIAEAPPKAAPPEPSGPHFTSAAEDLMKSVAELLKRKRLRASDLFKKIDSSGDGNVTGEELRMGLHDLGFKLSDADLASIMAVIDKDGGGEVSVKEFDRAMRAAEKLPSKKEKHELSKGIPAKKAGITEEEKEEFRQIFCLFKQLTQARSAAGADENVALTAWNETGHIGADDLETLLEAVGLKLSPLQMEAMIGEIDVDGNGEIDFGEFCNSMARRMSSRLGSDELAALVAGLLGDDRSSVRTYMHAEVSDSQVEELLQHYKECFVSTPESEWEFFKYKDYIDLMSPLADRQPSK
ncbi:unnamed protein product [Durusdinium trenchii]|uniref:Calmodulin n=1 Tax=Durusdinium trenchii TaxID=1381693 RepID=A0ABP0PJR4_9DINO